MDIEQVRTLADPLRVYNFEVYIPNVPGGGNGQEMSYRCTAANIPGFNYEKIAVNLGGHEIEHVGRQMYSHTWACSFIEGENSVIRSALEDWGTLQGDRLTAAQQPSSVYKTEIYIRQLKADKVTIAREWKLVGAFVEDVADISLDRATSDAVRTEVTFSFDAVIPQ